MMMPVKSTEGGAAEDGEGVDDGGVGDAFVLGKELGEPVHERVLDSRDKAVF